MADVGPSIVLSMNNLDLIKELRGLLMDEGIPVGEIEMTSGNYDDNGNLIKGKIPTITTDLCEIGSYENKIYFVIIVLSESFSEKDLNDLGEISGMSIYPLRDFNSNLYPVPGFNYDNFRKEISGDKYLQIQFEYDTGEKDARRSFKEYQKIKDVIANSDLKVFDQLGGSLS
jgi:hypothetical protein